MTPRLMRFKTSLNTMAIRVVEFSSGGWGTKLERVLLELLNFENWCSGELSKIGHHFINEVI